MLSKNNNGATLFPKMSIDAKHLLEISEECVKSFTPATTTVDAHADDFLGIEGNDTDVIDLLNRFTAPHTAFSCTPMICSSNKFCMAVLGLKSA